MNSKIGRYKDINDPSFYDSINNKKEFYDNNIDNRYKDIYCLEPQQRFLSNFINPLTFYDSVLIYHSVGVGKTLSAISICENFKNDYKIVVLTKNKNIERNFKKEILGICSNYFDNEEQRKIYLNNNHEDNEAVKTKLNSKINKHYMFLTYGGVLNTLRNNIDNTVLVIDEVHNITGNQYYDDIISLLKKSKNVKTVLLSATPVYDNIREIFEIANLLGDDLPIRNELVKNKMIKPFAPETSNSENEIIKKLLNDTVDVLTEKGEKELIKSLKGKVSFLKPDPELFPKRINNGTPVQNSSLKIYKSEMSSFQEDVYTETFNETLDPNVLFNNSSNALTMVYPDKTHGKKGFVKNITNKKPNEKTFLKIQNIKKYSCKLFTILDNLKKSPGPCFVYSNFVNYNGTDLIKEALKMNGYSYYNSKNSNDKYVVLDSSISPLNKQRIMSIFNDKKNAYGKYIKVLVGSPVVSEGLSFKNIRQIHILEPYWNLSRIEQVIGRGVRLNSHRALQPVQRTCEIFLHAAVPAKNDASFSIDYLKYLMSSKKDKMVKNLEKLLRHIAIDCCLNKKRNLKNYKNDYTCASKCERDKNDYSTYYLLSHDKELFNFILLKIKELFKIGYVYDAKFIVKYINSKTERDIKEKNIYHVINYIIENEVVFQNPLNRPSYLLPVGNYYILNPEDNEDNYNSFFNKIYYKNKQYKKINEVINIKNKSQDKKSVNIVPANKATFKKFQDKDGIVGTYLNKYGVNDGVFRIIDNRRASKKSSDNRAISSGKDCLSFSKQELTDMINFLNIKSSKIKARKKDYCDEIVKGLNSENKIIQS